MFILLRQISRVWSPVFATRCGIRSTLLKRPTLSRQRDSEGHILTHPTVTIPSLHHFPNHPEDESNVRPMGYPAHHFLSHRLLLLPSSNTGKTAIHETKGFLTSARGGSVFAVPRPPLTVFLETSRFFFFSITGHSQSGRGRTRFLVRGEARDSFKTGLRRLKKKQAPATRRRTLLPWSKKPRPASFLCRVRSGSDLDSRFMHL